MMVNRKLWNKRSWSCGYKTFFKLDSPEHEISTMVLIDIAIVKISGKFRFKTKKTNIFSYLSQFNNCWHFYIYEQDKF